MTIVPDKRSFQLSWPKADGDADNYTITVDTGDDYIARFNTSLQYPGGEITGLTPGVVYEVSIVTISGNEESKSYSKTARTNPDSA